MTMSVSTTSFSPTTAVINSKSKRLCWNNPFRKSSKAGTCVDNQTTSETCTSPPDPNSLNDAVEISSTKKIVLPSSERTINRKVGVVSRNQYAYKEASPDYGYEPAVPDSERCDLYEYGDTEQTHSLSQHEQEPRRRPRRRSSMPCSTTTAPRRSSMKQVGAPTRESITCKGEIEVSLPPAKKGEGRQMIKRRTSLTFSEENTVNPIEPAKNLARSPEDLWFQDHEMQQIRKKVSALIHMTEDGCTPHNGKRYCMRGLERLVEPELVAVKRNQAWETVFMEQYLQQCEGIVEEDHLANLYKFSTLRSRKDAEIRAMEDAKEVEKYLRAERQMYRRMSM